MERTWKCPRLPPSAHRLILILTVVMIDLFHSFQCYSGVVLLDKNQGFWLVHSTPHFPAVRDAGQYFYPSTGLVNGQNFICVTYPLERFQTIGKTAEFAGQV